MKQIFKKIPITIWTLILIVASSYIIFSNYINPDTVKLDNLSKVLTIIGIYFLAIQVKNQTRTNQISNEYLNQSNFRFNGFCEKELIYSRPCLCSEPGSTNYNKCTDIHWFNITQIGKLPAKDVRITLIHENEKEDFLYLLPNRTQEEPILYENDEHQFQLGKDLIPNNYIKLNENGKFHILIEYISLYTDIKYKRVYELNYTPLLLPITLSNSWIKNIKYYGISLTQINDSETQK